MYLDEVFLFWPWVILIWFSDARFRFASDGLDGTSMANLPSNFSSGEGSVIIITGSKSKHVALNWPTRAIIFLGTASGLAFLNKEVEPPIVHKDIRASNILLDGNFHPNIEDFGLAKLFPDNVTHVSWNNRLSGIRVWQCALLGQLTKMADVNRFGVLLLEIISGRSSSEKAFGEEFMVLAEWVTKRALQLINQTHCIILLKCSVTMKDLESTHSFPPSISKRKILAHIKISCSYIHTSNCSSYSVFSHALSSFSVSNGQILERLNGLGNLQNRTKRMDWQSFSPLYGLSVVTLFASALDNFKKNMDSATRQKSSDILTSTYRWDFNGC